MLNIFISVLRSSFNNILNCPLLGTGYKLSNSLSKLNGVSFSSVDIKIRSQLTPSSAAEILKGYTPSGISVKTILIQLPSSNLLYVVVSTKKFSNRLRSEERRVGKEYKYMM